MSLNILNVIELGCEWVINIDDDDLPVCLFLVEEGHDTEDLDLLDLTRVSDQFTNFADIQWVIITLGLGLWVNNIGIFPCLPDLV